jgi:hypothetical protein
MKVLTITRHNLGAVECGEMPIATGGVDEIFITISFLFGGARASDGERNVVIVFILLVKYQTSSSFDLKSAGFGCVCSGNEYERGSV